jgi:predicted phage replisome organizer
MNNVKWVKLCTDIFSNRKVKILLKERDGDTFFRVWIQLLTIAGECNRSGGLFLNDNKPFTLKELANIIGKTEKKFEKILTKMIELGMITYEQNTYIIKNWGKYQSIDKLEKMRIDNNERQRRYRERKKEKSNVMQMLNNIDNKEKDIRKEGERKDGISKFQEFN